MTENERWKLIIWTEVLYEFMSKVHSEICKLTDRNDTLSDDSCEICHKLINLKKKLGGFDNDE